MAKIEPRDAAADKFAKPLKWCFVDENGKPGKLFHFTPHETYGNWERVVDSVEALSYEGNTKRIRSKVLIYMSDGSLREIRGFFADPLSTAL